MWIYFTLITLIQAHSWLECTDYRISSFDDIEVFNRSKCHGYMRSFARQFDTGFGIDTGLNFHGTTCRDDYDPTFYNDKIPMARYTIGQNIYISHPSKNHVADICTNPFIPSTSLKLLASSQAMKDIFDITIAPNGGEHVNGHIDHLGNQRCYKFCENMDKASCYESYTIPSLSSGIHSFKWLWEFNPNEFYTVCFDAMIDVDMSNESIQHTTDCAKCELQKAIDILTNITLT